MKLGRGQVADDLSNESDRFTIVDTNIAYPHLTTRSDGEPRIGASRYKVLHLASEHYHYGWSAEELLRQHPDLRPEEVHAALTYFYDHFDPIVDRMKADAREVAALRSNQALSRDGLLRKSQGPA